MASIFDADKTAAKQAAITAERARRAALSASRRINPERWVADNASVLIAEGFTPPAMNLTMGSPGGRRPMPAPCTTGAECDESGICEAHSNDPRYVFTFHDC